MPAGAIGTCWAVGSWSDLAWEQFTWEDVSATLGNNNPDMNTRIRTFLAAFYSAPEGADLTSLVYRYLREEKTGEYTARWKAMEADATA